MRLIDADAAVKNFCDICKLDPAKCGGKCWPVHFIEKQETVDAVPVKHGHWEFHPEMFEPPKCSECGVAPKTPGYLPTKESYHAWFKYCPNCGVEMRRLNNETA